jgi:hypothetical protein
MAKFSLLLVAILAGLARAVFPFAQIVAKVQSELSPRLSASAFISFTEHIRWSDYAAPDPAVVVNVASELDVQATVSEHLNGLKIPFACLNSRFGSNR